MPACFRIVRSEPESGPSFSRVSKKIPKAEADRSLIRNVRNLVHAPRIDFFNPESRAASRSASFSLHSRKSAWCLSVSSIIPLQSYRPGQDRPSEILRQNLHMGIIDAAVVIAGTRWTSIPPSINSLQARRGPGGEDVRMGLGSIEERCLARIRPRTIAPNGQTVQFRGDGVASQYASNHPVSPEPR